MSAGDEASRKHDLDETPTQQRPWGRVAYSLDRWLGKTLPVLRRASHLAFVRLHAWASVAVYFLRTRVRFGWYVLLALALYAVVITLRLSAAQGELAAVRAETAAFKRGLAIEGERMRWPLIGARVPSNDLNLPGASRAYRKGVSEGVVFVGEDAGMPLAFGTPVVASADGQAVRVDREFKEMTAQEFQALLQRVSKGSAESDLDHLRGRQVWIAHANGLITRYAHLSLIAVGLRPGARVQRGQIIGYVGNSGTEDGVRRARTNPRLLFEVWQDGRFLGQGLKPDEVRGLLTARIQRWP